MEISDDNKPPYYFPQSIPADAYSWKPFANGTRMLIHEGKKAQYAGTVLRAPRKTERELNGTGMLSDITKQDIAWQTILKHYLRNNVEEVFPFLDQDSQGKTRAYSIQRKINIQTDLSHCFGDPCVRLSTKGLDSFAKLISGIRRLIQEQGIIPDIVGHGNVVATADDRVILVDINNLRPHLSGLDFLKDKDEEKIRDILNDIVYRGKDPRSFVTNGYLDEQGNPIGDASLFQLRNWDLYLNEKTGVRKTTDVLKDPLYEMFEVGTGNPIPALRNRLFNMIMNIDSALNLA